MLRLLAVLLTCAPAVAFDRVIVPSGPGGIPDAIGRIVAGELGATVENAPTGNGKSAFAILEQRPGAILLGLRAFRDGPFSELCVVARSSPFMVSRGPYPSIIGTPLVGSAGHEAAMIYRGEVRRDVVIVPHRTGIAAFYEFIGGRVDAAIASNVAFAREARLPVAMTFAPTRTKAFPETPSATELGIRVVVREEFALYAHPSTTPGERRAACAAANRAMQANSARLEGLGVDEAAPARH